jgi:hypothetical protein
MTCDEERKKAIKAYATVLSRLADGERTKEARDDFLWAWLMLDELGVSEDSPDFLASIMELRSCFTVMRG